MLHYLCKAKIRGGVEKTRLEAKDTKKSEAKAKDSPSEDRPSRGQGQGPKTQAQVFSKKKAFKFFFQAISKRGNQKRSSQIFREVSAVFLHNFKNKQIPRILGTDANAHHTIWRSCDINPNREDLLAYCVSEDLNFCNVGSKPTFRSKTREEVLDLTLVNRYVYDRVVGWHVSNVLSFSDHMYIRFQVKSTIQKQPKMF